ncbi:hypothetical protein C8J57DRAFT_1310178 [Mycena rebaudengoi]|nr:hypothetical protein C8J57DRAFT_1310178 [Mycena rebaudengoi]
MFPFTVTISVDPGRQRGFQIQAPGFRALFQSTVSGILRSRKRKPNESIPRTSLPSPYCEATYEESLTTIPPTVTVEQIHKTLMSNGIVVRDFYYPPTTIGHLNPVSRSTPMYPRIPSRGGRTREEVPSKPGRQSSAGDLFQLGMGRNRSSPPATHPSRSISRTSRDPHPRKSIHPPLCYPPHRRPLRCPGGA